MEGFFEVGRIVNTQGIKGNIRVFPLTDNVKRFELLKTVKLVIRGEVKEFEVEKVGYHKQFVLLKLKGIDDMTAAEKLKGTVIIVSRDEALPLEEDEYYIRDLVGLAVFTEDGQNLGELADIIVTGANDVYVVKKPGGNDESGNKSSDKGRELLIPAIKQCILNVDVVNKKMIVRLLEGLTEL